MYIAFILTRVYLCYCYVVLWLFGLWKVKNLVSNQLTSVYICLTKKSSLNMCGKCPFHSPITELAFFLFSVDFFRRSSKFRPFIFIPVLFNQFFHEAGSSCISNMLDTVIHAVDLFNSILGGNTLFRALLPYFWVAYIN